MKQPVSTNERARTNLSRFIWNAAKEDCSGYLIHTLAPISATLCNPDFGLSCGSRTFITISCPTEPAVGGMLLVRAFPRYSVLLERLFVGPGSRSGAAA